ncbi:DUF1365 domain-containing protein [Octadecabacter sp. G9-8]|uniref:DUF1365 domain-containing protein n=1 Tax=Octadecabacter dasysiphoniae TaxID=2909341 RepID=A0ABS9CVF3_9RHOB|nr:DUF1365 domain-containing protein [Octadecabacter dasysiphoniae]
MTTIQHIAGETYHGRRGETKNAFRYSIDYVLLDAEKDIDHPALFSRNGRGVMSLHDVDHGGAPKAGIGAAWVRDVLQHHQLNVKGRVELLAQPRVLGHVFNPVSFWLCYDEAGTLRVVIAEVSNTFGDRHSYLCHHDDLRAITKADTISAQKIFHVSPFQDIAGEYTFRFDIQPDSIGVWIDFSEDHAGLIATLTGPRKPLTNTSILKAMLRRPFGSRRVLALIHWQAVKLWWKGAGYRPRPEPPAKDVTR